MKRIINYCPFKFFKKTKSIEPIKNLNPCAQKVIRVLDSDSLLKWEHCHYIRFEVENINNPKLIGKIFEYLRTASVIRLYITKDCIEYSAETKKHGFVYGSCHRNGYKYFRFGLSRSGHRFDICKEDRQDPTIKAFYEWWSNLVKPYEEEFDNDYNL